MSHPPVPESRQDPRPRPVAFVVRTQLLTAAVLVVTALSFLAVQGSVQGEAERLMRGDLMGDFEVASGEIDWAVQGSFALMAVFYLVLAALYALLAALNRKGAEPGRLLTWVLSGLALACCLPAGLFTRLNDDFFAHRSLLPQDQGGMDYSNEANQWIQAAAPAWVTALDWLTVLLLTIGAIPVAILLATPTARRYFRRPDLR